MENLENRPQLTFAKALRNMKVRNLRYGSDPNKMSQVEESKRLGNSADRDAELLLTSTAASSSPATADYRPFRIQKCRSADTK